MAKRLYVQRRNGDIMLEEVQSLGHIFFSFFSDYLFFFFIFISILNNPFFILGKISLDFFFFFFFFVFFNKKIYPAGRMILRALTGFKSNLAKEGWPILQLIY